MTSQFMVRIKRNTDDDWADVVVNANDETDAMKIAIQIVKDNPTDYFGEPPQPEYYVDPSSDVADVTGGEYVGVNRL